MPRDRATDWRDMVDAGYIRKTCRECFEGFWAKDDTATTCQRCVAEKLAHDFADAIANDYHEDTGAYGTGWKCRYCHAELWLGNNVESEDHKPTCVVLKARALLLGEDPCE